MKPGIKKTMRVATTFTGVACAVAFNNPAALAATGQPAAQPGHQQHLRRTAIAGNKRLSGSIRESTCGNPNTSHWLHIGLPYREVTCIGFQGQLLMSPYPNMRSFCGGNNRGVIGGKPELGRSYYDFGPGNYFYQLPKSVKWFYVSDVTIWSWSRNDRCP
jgi:hypothetical protein